jgi:hypothetical protein
LNKVEFFYGGEKAREATPHPPRSCFFYFSSHASPPVRLEKRKTPYKHWLGTAGTAPVRQDRMQKSPQTLVWHGGTAESPPPAGGETRLKSIPARACRKGCRKGWQRLGKAKLFFDLMPSAVIARSPAEMKPRFGEMEARSMRDATEIQPRWMRDGSEIWRDAGLCKSSQFSRILSKLQRILLSGGFRMLLYSSRTCRAEVRRRRITHHASHTM